MKLFNAIQVVLSVVMLLCVTTIIATAIYRGIYHPALIIFLLIGVFSIVIVRQSFKELKENDDDDNM